MAASSTNWMRGDRAATRAARSAREMQSGGAAHLEARPRRRLGTGRQRRSRSGEERHQQGPARDHRADGSMPLWLDRHASRDRRARGGRRRRGRRRASGEGWSERCGPPAQRASEGERGSLDRRFVDARPWQRSTRASGTWRALPARSARMTTTRSGPPPPPRWPRSRISTPPGGRRDQGQGLIMDGGAWDTINAMMNGTPSRAP